MELSVELVIQILSWNMNYLSLLSLTFATKEAWLYIAKTPWRSQVLENIFHNIKYRKMFFTADTGSKRDEKRN